MQYINYIQSYQKFPSVIPVLKVSSLRVTHPSAMVTIVASYYFPINLHVLSILSAFILSQDQTLHSIYSILIIHLIFFSSSFFFSMLPIVLANSFTVDKIYITKFILLCQLLFFFFFTFFTSLFSSPPFLFSLNIQ